MPSTSPSPYRRAVVAPSALSSRSGSAHTAIYDLRSSIASLWYRQGIDKATIAARLGHSIPVLERNYARQTLDPLDKGTVDDLIADARKAQQTWPSGV